MAQFTIDPSTEGFSRGLALYLANACDLAYSDEPEEAAQALLGLDVKLFHYPASDTHGFVGRGDNFAVLAFRGSQSLNQHPKNWLANFEYLQSRDPLYPGFVHTGFSHALDSAWDAAGLILRPALAAAQAVGADEPGLPLFVTGHSLGGALATLASCRLSTATLPAEGDQAAVPVNLRACYTFGAPRVGDPDFCKAYKAPTYRVVHDLDAVPQIPLRVHEIAPFIPRLPSFTPSWLRNLVRKAEIAPPYDHVQTLYHLDAEGVLLKETDHSFWLSDYIERCLLSLGRSFDAPINDHMIDGYIKSLHG